MKKNDAHLQVVARSPFHIYYDGQADLISAANRVGSFDILPGHADFFSVMTPGEVYIDPGPDAEAVSFNITNGIMTVQDDKVILFVNM